MRSQRVAKRAGVCSVFMKNYSSFRKLVVSLVVLHTSREILQMY